VIEPVIERHAGDADAAIAHVGEIGQPEPARRMLLPEDNVPLGAVERPPGTDAPLQSAPYAGADLGMAPPNLIETRDRPQVRVLFNSGTTSLSQTTASGSRRRPTRGAFFCEGSRESCSMR
jgi:hypothetical protein